jgi:class 3 adenylate cyclase
MSFLETIEKARAFLERNGRVSLRALQREFNLDDDALDEVIEELAEIQRIAVRDGRALAWAGGVSPAPTETAEPDREPRDYTPKHLADKILQSKSALEGERKQVTVLFADVKGSLELAEQVDPEEWHRILDRFFQILADGIHRFEGTVNQYTGDGIMALFGAPIAHEDHAQRACYAALWLRDELRRYADELRVERGLNFSVRMGINSGEVIVGKIGDDLRMDYTAQGQTVGLAARMEQLAEPGKILFTEHTAHHASGYFQTRNLGATTVKGLREPLHIFELEGVGALRTRFDLSRARGLARFVGRADELRSLEAALDRSREGNGQVVGVVAEAGVGKSRLCFEFAERCRARGLAVYEGQAVAHGRNIPFLPILQVFRAYFGIAERDGDREAREKIAGRLLLLDEEFREILPVLFEFFGVADPSLPAAPIDPEARQRQLFAVLRRLVQQADPQDQAVTLIEDLHWIDPGSEAYLEQWVEALPGSSGLLLVNFRPEYRADWMQKSYYQQLPLAPLGIEASRELLEDLLGTDPDVAGLVESIQARTAGNPFFTEEVVQSLVESGHLEGAKGSYRLVTPIEKLEVPSSVQALLASRIDRLAERDKHLLQTAAVIGRTFDEPILEAVAELPRAELGEALAALETAELVTQRALYPVAEYAFKHQLTQEVELRSQLESRRRSTHAAVARATEAAHPERLDEHAALLAHHREQAGEALEAARWHQRAARWAGTSRQQEALRHWSQVRALLPAEGAVHEARPLALEARTQLLNLSWQLGTSTEEAGALLEEGRTLAEGLEDPAPLALLLGAYAGVRATDGHLDEALDYDREGVRLADRARDTAAQVVLRLRLGFVLMETGHLEECLSVSEEMLALSGGDWRPGFDQLGIPATVSAFHFKAFVLSEMGRHSEARQSLQGVVDAHRQFELGTGIHVFAEVFPIWEVALDQLSGDERDVLNSVRRAVEAAEKSLGSWWRVNTFGSLGDAHLKREEWQEAISALRHAEALARQSRTGLDQEAWLLAQLSRAHLGLGDLEQARTLAEAAVAAASNLGTRTTEIQAQLALARAGLATEDAAEAQAVTECLERAVALIDATGAEGYRPLVGLERAELAHLLGDEKARRRELREAHRLFVEMGAAGHAERVAGELGL